MTSPGRCCLRTTTQRLTSEQLQRDGAANTPLLETWERNKHWNMFSGHWTAQKTDYHFYSGQLRIIWYWIILFDKCRLLNCLFYLINSPRILNLVSRTTKRSSESSDKEAGTMSCSVFSLNEIDCHKRRVTLHQLIISALRLFPKYKNSPVNTTPQIRCEDQLSLKYHSFSLKTSLISQHKTSVYCKQQQPITSFLDNMFVLVQTSTNKTHFSVKMIILLVMNHFTIITSVWCVFFKSERNFYLCVFKQKTFPCFPPTEKFWFIIKTISS